ncbi:MAG: hypothetical protein NC935_02170 [Candidatus Omnitrophica bacterium]|nr:hypothetical protein [Candidatus Omnitrophota bacterium]
MDNKEIVILTDIGITGFVILIFSFLSYNLNQSISLNFKILLLLLLCFRLILYHLFIYSSNKRDKRNDINKMFFLDFVSTSFLVFSMLFYYFYSLGLLSGILMTLLCLRLIISSHILDLKKDKNEKTKK